MANNTIQPTGGYDDGFTDEERQLLTTINTQLGAAAVGADKIAARIAELQIKIDESPLGQQIRTARAKRAVLLQKVTQCRLAIAQIVEGVQRRQGISVSDFTDHILSATPLPPAAAPKRKRLS